MCGGWYSGLREKDEYGVCVGAGALGQKRKVLGVWKPEEEERGRGLWDLQVVGFMGTCHMYV